MKKFFLTFILTLSGCSLAGVTLAQGSSAESSNQKNYPPGSIYRCEASSGRFLSSDQPIPACHDKAQQVITPMGIIIDTIKPARQSQIGKPIDQVEEARARYRSMINTLIITYPDEATFEQKKQQQLVSLFARIKSTQLHIAQLNDQLNTNTFSEEGSSKDPQQLQNREKIQREIDVQERILESLVTQIETLTFNFEQQHFVLAPIWDKQK